MLTEQRYEQILKLLEKEGSITVTEVKELLNKKIEEERQAEQGVSRRNQCDYYLANLFGEQAFRFFISV